MFRGVKLALYLSIISAFLMLFLLLRWSKVEMVNKLSRGATGGALSLETPELSLTDLEKVPDSFKVRVSYKYWSKGKLELNTWFTVEYGKVSWRISDELEVFMDFYHEDYRLCSPSLGSAVRTDEKMAVNYYKKLLRTFKPIPVPAPSMLVPESAVLSKYKDKGLRRENVLGLPGLVPFHVLSDPALRTSSGVVLWFVENEKLLKLYWISRYRLWQITSMIREELGIDVERDLKSSGELLMSDVSETLMRQPVALIMEDANDKEIIAIELSEQDLVEEGPCYNLLSP